MKNRQQAEAMINDCECGCNTNQGLGLDADMNWEGTAMAYWVTCPNCHRVGLSSPSQEMAVEAWNEGEAA